MEPGLTGFRSNLSSWAGGHPAPVCYWRQGQCADTPQWLGQERQARCRLQAEGVYGKEIWLVLGSQSFPHRNTTRGVSITDLYFTGRDRQWGSAAFKPQTKHAASTCRNRLGKSPGLGWGIGIRGQSEHPCQDAWALGSSASTRERRQKTGLLPHGWNPITSARKKDGTRSMEFGQSIALDSTGGWHSPAQWKGPAQYPGQCSPCRKRIYRLSSSQQGLTLIPERLSRVETKPHSTQ